MDNIKEKHFSAALVFWIVVLSCIYCIESDYYLEILVSSLNYRGTIDNINITLSYNEYYKFKSALCNDSGQIIKIELLTGDVGQVTTTFEVVTQNTILSRVYFCSVFRTSDTTMSCQKFNTCDKEVYTFIIYDDSNICDCKCISFCQNDNLNISRVYYYNESLNNRGNCEGQDKSNQTQTNIAPSTTLGLPYTSSSVDLSISKLVSPTSEYNTNTLTTERNTRVLSNNSTVVTYNQSPYNTQDNNETLYIIIGCCVVGGVVIIVILIIVCVLLRKKRNKQKKNKYVNSTSKPDSIEIDEFQQTKLETSYGNVKPTLSNNIDDDPYNTVNVYTETHKSKVEKKTFIIADIIPEVDNTYSLIDRTYVLVKNKEVTRTCDNENDFNRSTGDQISSVYSRLGDRAKDFQNVYDTSPASNTEMANSNGITDTRVQYETDSVHMISNTGKANVHSYENCVDVGHSQDVYARVNKPRKTKHYENRTNSTNVSQV